MKKHVYIFVILFVCANNLFGQINNHAALKNKIQSIISKYKATVGLSLIHIENNDIFSLNDNLHFPMQSVYKFPLALAVLNEVDKGNLSLQKKVFINKEILSHYDWSPLKRKYNNDTVSLSIQELLYYSVSWSDNLSTDILFDVMKGTKPVNKYIHQLGFKDIEIIYTEREISENPLRYYKNYCKPSTMSLMLKKFLEKKILSEASTKILMHLMTDTQNSPARIKGELLPEIIVAHKTGTGVSDSLINVCNDVGIVTLPDGMHLAISVFVMNSNESHEITEHIISQISYAIINEFSKNQTVYSNTIMEYGNNSNAGKYITLNGSKHYYEVYGEGQPLLLIHGNSTPTRGWAPQIDYFKKKYKVYSIDCRGRGKSELGNDSLTYMQQAKDIAEFMEKLQLDSVNIVGKSDGGIIAILLGIYYPNHIKKMVAFGANMEPDSNALYLPSVQESHDERVKADKMLAAKDTTKNWLLEQQRYRMMEFQPHISAEDLHQINIPVLVMSCDRDVIKEEHTFFIYKNIPNANLCILPNEKHRVARLNPDLFNTTIDKYLSEPFHGNEFRFEK